MIAHLVLLVLAVASFLALCAGLPRYQRGLCGGNLSSRATRCARTAGWALLAALFVTACAAFGIGRGLVLVAAYATVGAGVTVALANRRSRGGEGMRK